MLYARMNSTLSWLSVSSIKPEVKFVGHIVGREVIKVNPQKVAVVRDWPMPRTVTDVRQFLTNF
jgi:hypothetical protein